MPMDITSLIAFSLTSKNSYNLVNKDYRIWERIGTSYNIGDTKLDCLYWLDDSFQPIKDGKAEKKRKAIERLLLPKAINNEYNNSSDINCELVVNGSAIASIIKNSFYMNHHFA
jgi:hypothetical protein